MTNTYQVLAQATLTTGYTNICAPASGAEWIVKGISVENTDSSERTVSLCVNGSTEASNRIFKRAVPADDGYDGDGTITLNGTAGDTLKGKASAGSVVVVTVYGLEVSS